MNFLQARLAELKKTHADLPQSEIESYCGLLGCPATVELAALGKMMNLIVCKAKVGMRVPCWMIARAVHHWVCDHGSPTWELLDQWASTAYERDFDLEEMREIEENWIREQVREKNQWQQ